MVAALVQVSREATQIAFLPARAMAQATTQHDVVLHKRTDAAGHDRTPGQGKATSRNAATSTEA